MCKTNTRLTDPEGFPASFGEVDIDGVRCRARLDVNLDPVSFLVSHTCCGTDLVEAVEPTGLHGGRVTRAGECPGLVFALLKAEVGRIDEHSHLACTRDAGIVRLDLQSIANHERSVERDRDRVASFCAASDRWTCEGPGLAVDSGCAGTRQPSPWPGPCTPQFRQGQMWHDN